MGYACPVCETPQADAEHLANHLAFTALLHEDEHAAWLAEHVPEWADLPPEALADRVAPHAPDAEYDAVFEDTTDAAGHGHGPGRLEDALARRGHRGRAPRDAETERVIAEARELTERMRGADEGDEDAAE